SQAMRSGQCAMCAVGMTEQEDRFADALDECDEVIDLIFEPVALGRVRLTAPAAGDGVDREVLLECRLHELPVGVVIAEGAMRQDQRRAAPAAVVRDGYPGRGCKAFHERLLEDPV